jgi:hypothetical protein
MRPDSGFVISIVVVIDGEHWRVIGHDMRSRQVGIDAAIRVLTRYDGIDAIHILMQ